MSEGLIGGGFVLASSLTFGEGELKLDQFKNGCLKRRPRRFKKRSSKRLKRKGEEGWQIISLNWIGSTKIQKSLK